MSFDLLLRVLLAGLLLVLGSGIGCGTDSSQGPSSKQKSEDVDTTTALNEEYWLFARVSDFEGNYKLVVNGFPVEREPVNVTMTNQEIGAKLNAALIGEGNTASVIVEPYLQRSGDQLVVGNVELEAWVSREAKDGTNVPIYELSGRGKEKGITRAEVDSAYQGWKKRALKQWDGYLKREKQWLGKSNDSSSAVASKGGSALDSIEAWSDRNPLEVSTTFDNEAGPDFSRIFEEAPRLPDTPATRERLRDYAMRLRDLMAAKDTSALFEEFRFYYAQQYKITNYEGGVEEDKASLLEAVVMENPRLDFSRGDVDLRRWSGGRVWELHRDGEAFFRSENAIREAFVSKIDGDLKVVR